MPGQTLDPNLGRGTGVESGQPALPSKLIIALRPGHGASLAFQIGERRQSLKRGIEIPSSAVWAFSDHDAYGAAVRANDVEVTLDGRADFAARIVSVGLPRLWMQRYYTNAALIARFSAFSGRAGLILSLQPGLVLNGISLPAGRIARYAPSQEFCLRTAPGSPYVVAMGLPIDDLVAAGAALADQDLTATRRGLIAEPKPVAQAKLVRLHAAIGRLAEDAPEIITNPAVAHGLEQSLIEAAVDCLCDAEAHENTSAQRRRELIMRRFFRFVEERPSAALYVPEICAAIGTPHRTLLLCCQERLGMAPKRFLLLRRLSLARRELREAHSATSVTEIATKYGFWEFGRFAGLYRSVFGESPSDTLRRVGSSSAS
jgi:AraC-like DNA-binding protein